MMALPTTYNTGTATVNANGTAVTGQGTTWSTSGVQAGDLFWAAGISVRIASVNSNTSLTLAYGWPGSNRAADSYEVRFVTDSTRALASTREMLDALVKSGLTALASLATSANKMAYYTGSGLAALTDLSAHGRSIIGLAGGNGKFIRSTGANTAVMQDIVGTVAQSSGVATGAIVERGSNANGEYIRFAGGLQICTRTKIETILWASDNGFFWGDNYPANFISAPVTTLIMSSSNADYTDINRDRIVHILQEGSSGSSWRLTLIRAAAGAAIPSTATMKNVAAVAIGRWY